MGYRAARWPKVVVGATAMGLIAYIFGAPFWHPFKERYFNYVTASCSETHGLGRIRWQEVPAFDAAVEWFVAKGEKELAVRDCIDRWAGPIMADRVSVDVSAPTIEFVLTDNHLDISSPPRQVYYAYLQPTD